MKSDADAPREKAASEKLLRPVYIPTGVETRTHIPTGG